MFTGYATELSEEDDLLYPQSERTSDLQLPPAINILLLAIWIAICLIGFAVIFLGKYPVAGTMIIAVPTFLGMVIKPSFALCMFALVLPTSAGVGLGGVFTMGRGVGIALAIAFALNLLITHPPLHIRNKAIWVIMLFTLWVFFASLLSPYPRYELVRAFTQFQLMLLVLITYWILETNSEKAFIWVLRSYVIGSLGTIIITFMTGAAMRSMTDVTTTEERYGATLGQVIDQNGMAVLIAMAFLAAIYLFARDKNIFWRVIYLIAMGFLPIMILRTGSRGGLIALAFTLMSPLLFIRQVWRRPALTILLLFVIILAAGSSAYLVQTKGLPGMVRQRLTSPEEARQALALRMSLNMAAVHVGLTRFFGSGSIAWFELSGTRLYPHNDFFRALGYHGVPGAVLFVIFMIMMMFTVKRIPLGAEKLYARAVLTFLLVMGLALGQLEEKYLWLFLAMIMAAERIAWLHSGLLEKLPESTDLA